MTVYLIQAGDGGPIKIGASNGKHLTRLSDLQVAHSQKLLVVGLIDDADNWGLEGELHRYFRSLRIRGEWFKYAGRLRKFVEKFPHDMHRKDAPMFKLKFWGKNLAIKRIQPKRKPKQK